MHFSRSPPGGFPMPFKVGIEYYAYMDMRLTATSYINPTVEVIAQLLNSGSFSRYVRPVIITHTANARAVYTPQPACMMTILC